MKAIWFHLGLVLVSFFASEVLADETVRKAEEDRVALVEKTMQSVIAVFPASDEGPLGGGSGVVISPDGYAFTNFHVVQPCGVGMKCGMADGKLYDAVVVGLDPAGDIALIKLLGRNDFPAAIMGNSDTVRLGDASFVMGNPFMLAGDFKPCVSYGIISGTHRYQYPSGTFLEYADCLQTDAAVNPGNSGGPLFNAKGELIGIIGRCSFEKRGRINVGIGYAVSVNQTKNFLGALKSGAIVDHASAGMVVGTNDAGKVLIEEIAMSNDAFRWGVRWDDEVIRFAGRSIDTANTFKNTLGIFPKGWRVPLTVRTPDGKRHDINVRLTGLHGEAELLDLTEKMLEPPIPPEKPKRDIPDLNPGEKNEEGAPIELPFKGPLLEKAIQKVKEPPVPEFAKPFYEKKRGFANFYFNRMEQARVLEKWKKTFPKGTIDNPSAEWVFNGKISGHPDTYRFNIDDLGVGYELPTDKGLWLCDPKKQEGALHSDPGYHYVAPRGSGGLFAAIYLWRLMALRPNQDFGNVTYGGTAPIRGDFGTLYDVLDVYWESVSARFYYSQEDGRLVLMEFFPSVSEDFSCEIYFNKYVKTGEGALLASELEVRYGPVYFGSFELESFKPLLETMAGEPLPEAAAPTAAPDPAETASVPGFLAPPRETITESAKKVVKIYGAGGLAGLSAYQSGCIISSDGLILTVISGALEADPITVVMDNGRKFEAKIFAADPTMELAILKIEASGLPFFEIKAASELTTTTDTESDTFGFDTSLQIGDPVLALSNTFNIASGNETVSVQGAVLAARTNLKARRGMFETTYKGPVYVIDRTTNNPGGKGGALVRRDDGRLIGIIGKELRNSENNTWFNFVLPSEQIRERIKIMIKPDDPNSPITLISKDAMKPEIEIIPEDTERILRKWGLLLVTNVGARTPPFVDTVRTGSKAAELGVKPDDLIVMINNRLAPSRNSVEQQILSSDKDKPISITFERKMELIDLKFERE